MEIAIIIQARMTSTRLPGKILLPVLNKSFFEIQINRLKPLNIPLIIATTNNDSDNPIVSFADEKKINCYRGSEENVLQRYYLAAKEFNVKTIIRITSDCPLIDINCIQQGLDYYINLKDENSFVSNTIDRTYPRGFDFEIFSFKQLEKAYLTTNIPSDLEHVTPYLWKNKNGEIRIFQIKNNENFSKFRLTLDTSEDHKLLITLIEKYNAHEKNSDEIYQILIDNPDLAQINSHIEQKKVDSNPRKYQPLHKQNYIKNNYELIPIRDEDKYDIMNWRNDQIIYLRQDKPLKIKDQDLYFSTIVNDLFTQKHPNQLLFSFLENNKLIGYGGLVHINWSNKTAEISFLTSFERANNSDLFISDWKIFLSLIKEIANIELNFNSIFTYAYDLRPLLYEALTQSGFLLKEKIKNAYINSGNSYDVLIHEFKFDQLYFKFANENDLNMYFEWANDNEVRLNSFNQNMITYEQHSIWFKEQLKINSNFFYIFFNQKNEAIGQVRISKKNNETIIGVSIDKNHRRNGYAAKIISIASKNYLDSNINESITAYIKISNINSLNSFLKAGYEKKYNQFISNIESYVLKFEK